MSDRHTSRRNVRAAAALACMVIAGPAAGAGQGPVADAPPSAQFTNPLLDSGPDPWVTRDGDRYYYMHTLGNALAIWETRDIADLAKARRKTVWTPPKSGPNAISIWAPELHRIDGRWYIYYTAAESGHDDDAHRGIFVLENGADNPLEGTWVDRGRVNTRYPGIDGTVFAYRGNRYFVYSPYVGPDSVLAIARMSNPWTLAGDEAIIARPELSWERQGGRQILEGPEFLLGFKGDLFLTYSASACWSDDYALGLLRAPAGADPLDPKSWTKSPKPVFAKAPENGVYAPGHNGFFTSPDGRETWIIYHANPGPDMKCTARRSPRIQRVEFDASGTPQFGKPVSGSDALLRPSGG